MREIAGISMATRQILRDLAARYAAEAGCAVRSRRRAAADTVRGGVATDVVILAACPMAKLEA